MQATLDAEFGKDSSGEEEGEGESAGGAHDGASGRGNGQEAPPPGDTLFCPACNKLFKSSKA